MIEKIRGMWSADRAAVARETARRWLPLGVAGLIGVLGGAVAFGADAPEPSNAGADQFGKEQRRAIEAIVRQYILDHPEVIPEAINRLQEREVTKLLDSNRKEIETPFAGAYAGNKDGDVVLVEFFDYACGYCKLSFPDVERLIREDKGLKVVYRDFPVLSPASQEAALASLSAAKQGRYEAFHDRMFQSGARLSHERIIATVRAAGLNEMQTARDLKNEALQAEVKKNLDLGRALGLTGTPTYIVGNRILSGAVGYEELKKAIADARAAG